MTLPFPLTISEATSSVALSPMQFGGIWDGGSHPLSERYSTLAEAQVVYPHALALTDEIDWAATQKAINQVILGWDAHGARYGATISLPSGAGRFNRALFYPANSVWDYEDFPGVNIEGQGRHNSLMEWRDNSATIQDGYALQPRTATVTSGAVVWSGDHSALHSATTLRGFSMRGPGDWRGFVAPTSAAEFTERYGFTPTDWTTAYNTSSPQMGQVYENFSGISAGERTNIDDVCIRGFHVGLNLRGGQKWHRGLFIDQCYYGMYGTFTTAAHGDMTFEKCNFQGRMACFAMHPEYSFYGSMNACFFGGSPYAFLKERSTSGSNHWADFVHGHLRHCQFEGCDNGIIVEGNAGTMRHTCRDLVLDACLFVPLTGTDTSFPETTEHHLIDVVTDAPFYFLKANRVDIRRSHSVGIAPGDDAMFKFGQAPTDFHLTGAEWWISQAAAGSKPVFDFVPAVVQPGTVTLEGEGWRGTALRFGTNNGHDAAIGHVVGQKASRFFGRADVGDPVWGVAMEANPTPSSDVYLCVATEQVGVLNVRQVSGSSWPSGDRGEFEVSSTELGAVVPLDTGSAIGVMYGTNGATNIRGHMYNGGPGTKITVAADQAAYAAVTPGSNELVILNA